MKIISPISSGNGACVVHQMLETHISDYRVLQYNPYLTLIPPLLYFTGRNNRADIIHTPPDYAIYHQRSNVPMVVTFHGYVLDSYIRKYSNLMQSLHYQTDLLFNTKLALSRAKIITAVSQYIANIVSKELNPDQEIRTIYNGVDESLFLPSRSVENKAVNSVKVLLGGHLSAKKGSHWVEEILNRLDSNISISYTTGLGSNRRYPPHPRLTCLGRIPYKEMPSLYKQFDMLLFPTVREGFGLFAAEAMSCGLPVVTTNCSALPELIEHGKGGYLCELGDVVGFAEKINQLAENIGLRREMGEFNRIRVEEKFTLARMIKEYKEVFEEAAS